MNQLLKVQPPAPEPSEDEDPFRNGCRTVQRTRPDGQVVWEDVPLTWEDVLFPEEGDRFLHEPYHLRDATYLHYTLETHYHGEPAVVVLGDCRIDWGVREIRPMGPDIVVLFDVRVWQYQGTFRIADEGGRPVLVMEVASRSTYDHDFNAKPPLFLQAGVEVYVIVDRGPRGRDPVRLRVFRRGPDDWVEQTPDAQGRFSLAPVPFLIGIEGGLPWLYDAATGTRMPDHTERTKAQQEAEARARQETEARAALEERVRQLEEQLRGQSKPEA